MKKKIGYAERKMKEAEFVDDKQIDCLASKMFSKCNKGKTLMPKKEATFY